ncbi:RNA polymerase sigma factor [Celeribacter sp. ULVN23_4]
MAWDFQKLFQRHAGGIARSLQRRGLDAEVACDLTQEAFVRAIAAQPESDAPDHLTQAYLYKVARNLGINYAKRQALFSPVSLDAPEAQRVLAREPDTETIVASREQLRIVRAVLTEMPERQRRAFLLHRIENRPMARIAEELGLSTTRIWELVHDAYLQIVLRTGGL